MADPHDAPAVAVTRGGDASDEEVAAIVAAVEVTWPRPVGLGGRRDVALAVLGPVVVEAGAAAPRPPLVATTERGDAATLATRRAGGMT